jgi:hypothetical protein
MLDALTFDLKRSWVVLLACGVAVVAARGGVLLAETAAVVLVWLLLYRLNVEEKVKKTWDFFHALPLGRRERAVLKIGVPFVIALAVLSLSESDPSLAYVLEGKLAKHIMLAAILVLASIVARTLIHYILIFWAIYVPAAILGVFGLTELVIAGLGLGLAYASMSGHRVSPVKAGVVALCVALPLTIAATLSRVPVYRALMKFGGPETRLDAAVHLVSEENDEPASVVLAGMLRQDPDAKLAERIFDAYEASDQVPELGAAEYQTLLASDAAVRRIVLDYLAHDGDAYDWLTVDRVLAWEPLVLERRKPADEDEEACSGDCEALADLVADRFLDELEWPHFEAHLSSADPVRVEYALLVE